MRDKITLLKEALKIIKANGLNPALYVVIGDAEKHLVVKQRFTGEVKVLDKEGELDGKTVFC